MEDLSTVSVVKRDGSSEGFARTKIYNGVFNSGVSQDVAEGITLLIEGWIMKNCGVEGSIKSSDIREKVISLLELIDDEAATHFRDFKRSV